MKRVAGWAGIAAAATIALPLLSTALDAELPRPNPGSPGPIAGPGPAVDPLVTGTTAALVHRSDGLAEALAALGRNDGAAVLGALGDLPPIERDVVLWVAIRRGLAGIDPATITDFATRNPHWPTASLMRRRAEQALARADVGRDALLTTFAASPPITTEGITAYADALIADGRAIEAAAVLGPWWATETLTPADEARHLARYGDVITPERHRQRFEMLMYADRVVQATTIAKRVGPEAVALAAARAAVLRNAKDAAAKLDALPASVRKSPLAAFTRAEWHRRADRNAEAAKELLSVSGAEVEAHGDAWWVERRIVSRGLLEERDARTAYALAAAHAGGDAETRAEALFHAGWYALRFLKDPAAAKVHFEALQRSVSMPQSRSRAAYWLGRTAEAAGRLDEARQHFTVAATDEATYYGQLARVKLGVGRLDLPPLPEPTAADRDAFARNDLVRAAMLLAAAGRPGDAAVLYPELARRLPSGGQLVLLADLAARGGNHRLGLQVGKIAADRGLGVERLAFPLDALPESARADRAVETAMIYAIARQESAFDPAAVSQAGAKGLLQLLPSTAAATAKTLGIAFTEDKLTRDPAYNATLGAAHLGHLVEDFGGSYILTFAAYNAGPRRARQWIERFGDPRDPAVDPIDWVELIPFGETRNYVQRVTENLQVYRERLHDADLAIAADLRRGLR